MMTLRNDSELANTRIKLAQLQHRIEEAQKSPGPGQSTELRSLTRLANQLREEIARYQAALSGTQQR